MGEDDWPFALVVVPGVDGIGTGQQRVCRDMGNMSVPWRKHRRHCTKRNHGVILGPFPSGYPEGRGIPAERGWRKKKKKERKRLEDHGGMARDEEKW